MVMPNSINRSDKLYGKSVILLDDEIIASGDDVKLLLDLARERYSGKKFALAKVPEKGTLIY